MASKTLVCWNGKSDIPFLFVDPNGVEDHMRIVAPINASYLHYRHTKTVGDCRISHQDFFENINAIIDREGSVHALVRSMYAQGASACDVAVFVDCLRRNDIAVAQPLSQIDFAVIDRHEHVRFSDASGSPSGVGRDILVFGDGTDDNAVDACIIAGSEYDLTSVTYPDGTTRNLPIGRHALSALIASLRAVDAGAMDRIAIAGPIRVNAIPESMRATIEVRIRGAFDVSTVRSEMASYSALDPTIRPVAVSTNAVIAVVRHATGETIVEVPIMTDMLILNRTMSRTHLMVPTYDDVEKMLRSFPMPGGDLMFILAHTAERLQSFMSMSHPERVLDLANLFRCDIRNLVDPVTRNSIAERHLVHESAYIYFPMAIHTLSEWIIDDDAAFSDIESALHSTGVEHVTLERVQPRIWSLQFSSAEYGECAIKLRIDDDNR